MRRRLPRWILLPLLLVALITPDAASAAWHQNGFVGIPGNPDPDAIGVVGGIARRSDGNYLVTSLSTQTLAVMSPDGTVLRRWTGRGGVGPAFSSTSDVAIDGMGTVYVLDPNACLIHVLTFTGTQTGTFGTCGAGDGELTMNGAYGFALAPNGEVWVADTFGSRIVRFDSDPGRTPLPTIGTGVPGAALGEFNFPANISFAPDGTAWVAEAFGQRLQHISAAGVPLGMIDGTTLTPPTPGFTRVVVRPDGSFVTSEFDPAGMVTTAHVRVIASDGSSSALVERGIGTTGDGNVANPFGLALDADGAIVSGDQAGRIQRFHLNGPGAFGVGGSVDVLAESFRAADDSFARPSDVGVAPDGAVGVTDSADGRLRVFEPTGALRFATTPAGPAAMNSPHGVLGLADGTWWVADTYGGPDNRVVHFDATGTLIESFGTGVGNGAQELNAPNAVALDPSGDYLLIADGNNSRIQVLNLNTMVSDDRFGSNGNGPGDFNQPNDLTVGPDGRLYVVERYNQRVQAFTRTPGTPPTFTYDETIATGYGSERGRFMQPTSLAFDPAGNLAVLDYELARVQWFDTTTGELTDYLGDPGRDDGELFRPFGIAFQADGDLLVADEGNARVSRLAPGAAAVVPPITPNPPVGPPDTTIPTGTVTAIRSIGVSRSSFQSTASPTAWASTARGGSIVISGTVTDPGGGTPVVSVLDLDADGNRSSPAGGSKGTVVGSTWSATIAWDRRANIGGLHTVIFSDAAGNSTTATFTLRLDSTPPTVVIPRRNVRGAVHRFTVRDAGVGATVRTVTVRTRRLGSYRFRVGLRDKVGNYATRTISIRRVA